MESHTWRDHGDQELESSFPAPTSYWDHSWAESIPRPRLADKGGRRLSHARQMGDLRESARNMDEEEACGMASRLLKHQPGPGRAL